MPISEDEYDSRQEFEQDDRQSSTLSKAELRKTNKPIMEKKRRARINQCLGELKELILEAMKKDPSRHSKLEKADILEMTVRHLQALQRRSLATAASTNPEVLPKFRQGFSECAAEATKFLSRPPALPAPARSRLRQHLAACVAALHHPPASNVPHDLNGNIHVGGVPLIPSRLPTGELALVLPANTQLPFARTDTFQQDPHASAFQSVRNRPPSPASSVSSCDSLSSERGTPPLVSISNTFPTPPSQTSFNESSPETQKPIVSSTTISPENKPNDNSRQRGMLWRQTDAMSPPKPTTSTAIDYSMTPCRKKAYSTGSSSSNAESMEPSAKVAKIACATVSSSLSPENSKNARIEKKDDQAGSSSSSSCDMWRPW